MKGKIKVFIGLREVAGYFGNLKSGFDKLSVECAFMDIGGNRFNYPTGNNPTWVRFFNSIGRGFGKYFSGNFMLRLLWLIFFQTPFSFIALFFAVFKYNVFIMGSNSTFFYFLELPLLKLLGKKIIYVFLGSDSRPIYLNGFVMQDAKKIRLHNFLVGIQKRTVKIIERFADYTVNHPPQAHFHTQKYISLLCIGIPFDVKRMPMEFPEAHDNGCVNILHAPSKPKPKGSEEIRKIISNLKNKGYKINYTEISNLSNKEVLNKIKESDFVIDQLYSDTPMAVFATEAAFCGKPAVSGGYYSAMIEKDVPEKSIPPGIYCHPDKLEETVEKLIINFEYRKDCGEKAHAFVHEHWSSEIVAARFLSLVMNDVNQEWYFYPENLEYVHGCGHKEENAKACINAFIEKKGLSSLRMKHNRKLRDMLVEFARVDKNTDTG